MILKNSQVSDKYITVVLLIILSISGFVTGLYLRNVLVDYIVRSMDLIIPKL